jgi:DNA-directed RNA polymerase subunit H
MAEEQAKDQFNVLNHELVPIHELLSDEEVRDLYKNYNILAEQLPKILASDPAARAVGGQNGNVVRIRRKSKTAGEAIAYRYVIDYSN